MDILLTGASSFSGYWFARQLDEAGHRVVATFRRPTAEYQGVRRSRVEMVEQTAEAVHGCSFGDDRFLELIRDGRFDVVCHHGAEVNNYKSPDFAAAAAFAANTHRLREVFAAMASAGTRKVVLTGTVFEGGEGAGSDGLPHFSPYGFSKALTSQAFQYYGRTAGIDVGKFVMANPFGPYEEARFTYYLMKTWFSGEVPGVATPDYVRDNIHVGLLAKAYVQFAEHVVVTPGFSKLNPSGYIESQGAFARRFASEMAQRLSVSCELQLARQTEFPEPRIRINTDPVDAAALGFDETGAWDAIAEYYERIMKQAEE